MNGTLNMLDSNPVCTPMDTGLDLHVSEGESEMNESALQGINRVFNVSCECNPPGHLFCG